MLPRLISSDVARISAKRAEPPVHEQVFGCKEAAMFYHSGVRAKRGPDVRPTSVRQGVWGEMKEVGCGAGWGWREGLSRGNPNQVLFNSGFQREPCQ